MNREALLKQMQESQQPPTPEEQQEQEATAGQMARLHSSHQSKKDQSTS